MYSVFILAVISTSFVLFTCFFRLYLNVFRVFLSSLTCYSILYLIISKITKERLGQIGLIQVSLFLRILYLSVFARTWRFSSPPSLFIIFPFKALETLKHSTTTHPTVTLDVSKRLAATSGSVPTIIQLLNFYRIQNNKVCNVIILISYSVLWFLD